MVNLFHSYDHPAKHRFLPESHDELIALELRGNLDAAEYQQILPTIEKAIQSHEKTRIFREMKDFEGWTVGGMWTDGKFDIRHSKAFSKIAIVGEKKWHEWMTGFMKPFTSAEVRYFDANERASAFDWPG